MKIDIGRFREAFFEDAAEHLAVLEAGLLRLESQPSDQELLNSIFRSAHSIKGASGTFGFPQVARFTHSLESVLDRLRAGELSVTHALTDVLLHAADVLGGLLAAAKGDGPEPASTADAVAELDRIAGNAAPDASSEAPSEASSEASSEAPGTTRYDVRIEPSPDLLREGGDPLLLLRDLAELGEIVAVDVDASALPSLDTIDPERCYLRWTVRLATAQPVDAIREVFMFVDDSCRVTIGPADAARGEPARGESPDASAPDRGGAPGERSPAAATSAPTTTSGTITSSIRVPTARVDELVNLVGELVIAQSAVTQVIQNFSIDRLSQLEEAVATLERNTRDVQEKVMKIRMLPIGSVFSRFVRLVRDLAGSLGKDVALHLVGEETELDKEVIERIGDPLLHLVRNAVDHGIEPPEERVAAGKSARASVTLRASQEGGTIVIEVADDGRGLNTAAIRRKAVISGVLRDDDVLSDDQIHALIFRPGFSTATVVSDVSGRGVGMDVVKRNIESLGGSLTVTTVPGRGTRFHIRLPLTMAILDGLSVAVAGQTFVLPLLSVVDSFRPRAIDTKRLVGGGEIVMWRGESLPLIRLYELFRIDGAAAEATRAIVVIIEEQGRRIGLLVDDLVGQSQVVIKSLEANYKRLEGISGATIMGDGCVALILDVHGLAQLVSNSAPPAPADRADSRLAALLS